MGSPLTNSEKECDYPYTYNATILKIHTLEPLSLMKFYFKEKPSRYFWFEENELPPDITEGIRVKISYKVILVNTYSYFWIGSIQKEMPEFSSDLRLRNIKAIQIPKNIDNLYVKCNNHECKIENSLTDFIQCSGTILNDFTCDRCFSKHGFIGDDCIREMMHCKK